jgi:hypothetical protein
LAWRFWIRSIQSAFKETVEIEVVARFTPRSLPG